MPTLLSQSRSRFSTSVWSWVAIASLVLTCSHAAVCRAADDDDKRGDNLQTSAYFGLGIDSFAASAVNDYLNPGDSSKQKERGVGGFDFDYRLGHLPGHDAVQLWIYGETVHGVRSADINIRDLDQQDLLGLTGFSAAGGRTLYMLRNASTLETYGGARLECARVNAGHTSPLAAYLFFDYGFLSVAGLGQDVVDESSYGVGLVCIGGKMRDSHLQFGGGRTDLFEHDRTNRKKFDGELDWTTDTLKNKGMSMFAQITIDSDFGSGSDSVQNYFGFNFDLEHFLSPEP